MPLIGDELRTILGMMPVRDRAGIARGTMADDAMKASAAAESGNAEGAALMQQGGAPRPPMPGPPQVKLPPMGGPGGPPPGDIKLPEDVPTAFASGRGGGPSPTPVPAPQERVVAASPAAAPSRAVATASDAMVAAIEQRNRQAKMMQLVGSLGLIANAFNRNPQSQASTRNSLADMIGGGGGGGKGGSDLSDIKTIADMQRQEAADRAAAQARASSIGALVKRGMSPEEAAVEVDNDLHKQRLGATAEGILADRQRADLSREEMLRPAVVTELSKRFNQPEEVIRAGIRSGKIDPKAVSDILETGSQTASRDQKTKIEGTDFGVRSEAMTSPEAIAARLSARLGRTVTPDEVRLNAATEDNWKHWIKEVTAGGQADIAAKDAETKSRLATAEKTQQESMRALTEQKHREAVVKAPEDFVGLYKGTTPEQLREYARSEAQWKKFQEGQAPALTSKQQEYWTTYVPQAGKDAKTFDEWSKEQARAGGPSPEDLSKTEAVRDVMKTVSTKYNEANQVKTNMQNRQIIQEAWTDKIISGGMGVDKQLMMRSTAARMLGRPDIDVDNTQAFFGIMNTQIAEAAKLLPGPLSEKELQFIKDMKGGKELTPQGIRTLHIMLDKADHMKLETYNKWRDDEEKHPVRGKLPGQEMYGKVAPPEPGRFIREEIQDSSEAVARLRANPTPENKRLFNKTFGISTAADWALSQPEKKP